MINITNSDKAIQKKIDIIYLSRGIDWGIETASIFFASYKKYSAGYDHNLIVAAKAWDTKPEEYRQLKKLSEENNAKIINLPDDGLDFTAYYRAAIQSNADYVFCLTTSSKILADNWLKFFANAVDSNDKLKLIGASGSYEAPKIHWIPKFIRNFFYKNKIFNKHNINSARTTITTPASKKTTTQFLNNIAYKIKFTLKPVKFPNYHIRSAVFFIDRVLYTNFIKENGFPKNKSDAYKMESLYKNMTTYAFNAGFDVGVAGLDGNIYKKEEWFKSKTFRSPDTSNLIIADKQSMIYDNSDIDTKRILERSAWGKILS